MRLVHLYFLPFIAYVWTQSSLFENAILRLLSKLRYKPIILHGLTIQNAVIWSELLNTTNLNISLLFESVIILHIIVWFIGVYS